MDLEAYSPARLLRSEAYAGAAAFHPRVWLLHGDRDKTAPLDQSEEYYRALLKAGVRGALEVMVGHTHTSPLLEAPMSGQDRLGDSPHRAGGAGESAAGPGASMTWRSRSGPQSRKWRGPSLGRTCGTSTGFTGCPCAPASSPKSPARSALSRRAAPAMRSQSKWQPG